jgi:hypothetical protein
MKYTFIKYLEYKEGVITEHQLKAKIIRYLDGYVVAEYVLNGIKETRAVHNEDLREYAYVIQNNTLNK